MGTKPLPYYTSSSTFFDTSSDKALLYVPLLLQVPLVRAAACLCRYYLYSFSFTQFTQNTGNICFYLLVYNFSSIFWCKHNMVLTFPLRMSILCVINCCYPFGYLLGYISAVGEPALIIPLEVFYLMLKLSVNSPAQQVVYFYCQYNKKPLRTKRL